MWTAPTDVDGADPLAGLLAELAATSDPPTLPRMLEPGDRLGEHLEILARVGRGGMGVVYRARDHLLGRDVAIKTMRANAAGSAALRESFRREARATARLAHPNVVVLHQYGEHDGLLYLVLEHIDGETLAERRARAPLPRAEALAIIEQVAAGLAYAHDEGVLHRDVKPHNVLLGADGRARLVDFGIAALEGEAGALVGAGTPGYMAPEQWRGEPADARSDVWALGVMALELLSAGAVRAGDGAPRVAPRPPRDLPRSLARALRAATHRDREARTASAAAVARAVAAARAGTRGAARAGVRRRGTAVLVAAVLVAAVLVAAVLIPWAARPVLGAGAAGAVEAPLELSGTWAYVPEGRAAVELDRVGPDRYRLSYSDAPPGAPPSPRYFWIEGELTLSRDARGARVLEGQVEDRAGWGKGQVGHLRFVVEAEDRLRMTHSEWGRTHAFYHFHYPEWMMVRVRQR